MEGFDDAGSSPSPSPSMGPGMGPGPANPWIGPGGIAYSQATSTEPAGNDKFVFASNAQKPYVTQPIMNVDDYEYSLVFKNEGDREVTKDLRDKLMSQYPMDWSTMPSSSAQFQEGSAQYKEAFKNNRPRSLFEGFQSGDYGSVEHGPPLETTQNTKPRHVEFQGPLTLPDCMQSREIIQKYKPRCKNNPKTYDADDAREIIEKIYDAKGLVAEYVETSPNQFTVFRTRPKDEQIVYEGEEGIASSDAISGQGEDTITVPTIEHNNHRVTDPFFTPSSRTRDSKWDYTSWTPGLERMFAPTESREKWY